MHELRATPLYASLIAILAIALANLVITRRKRGKVSLGTGGDAQLERAIRAHANLIEYAPLTLLLLAFAELGGAPAWLIHAGGASLVLGRVTHAWALHRAHGRARVAGMILTFNALGLLVAGNLWLALR